MKAVTKRPTADQAQQLREAQALLSEAERDGWTIRPGSDPGVLVAELRGQRLYGRGELDLARVVEMRLRLSKASPAAQAARPTE